MDPVKLLMILCAVIMCAVHTVVSLKQGNVPELSPFLILGAAAGFYWLYPKLLDALDARSRERRQYLRDLIAVTSPIDEPERNEPVPTSSTVPKQDQPLGRRPHQDV